MDEISSSERKDVILPEKDDIPASKDGEKKSESGNGAEKVNGADIKDYAENTMNELLGLYGYEKVDSIDTRDLNLDRFKQTSTSASQPVPITAPNFETPDTSPDQKEVEAVEKESEKIDDEEGPGSVDSDFSLKDDQSSQSMGSPPEKTLASQHKLLVSALENKPDAPSPDPSHSRSSGQEPSSISISRRRDKVIICAWCLRQGQQLFTLSTEKGTKEFCSELCFTQCRRASFKKNKICDWCKHTRHTVNYVDFQDGDELLQFCTNKCLNQYKMNIFCCETQEQLKKISDNPETIEGKISPASNSEGSKILITPELWDREKKHKKRKHKKMHKKHMREKLRHTALMNVEKKAEKSSCNSLQMLSNLVGKDYSMKENSIIAVASSGGKEGVPPPNKTMDMYRSPRQAHENRELVHVKKEEKLSPHNAHDKSLSMVHSSQDRSHHGGNPVASHSSHRPSHSVAHSHGHNSHSHSSSHSNSHSSHQHSNHNHAHTSHHINRLIKEKAFPFAKSSDRPKITRPITSQLFNTSPLSQSPEFDRREPPTLKSPAVSPVFPRMPPLIPMGLPPPPLSTRHGIDPMMFNALLPPFLPRGVPPPVTPPFLENLPMGVPPAPMMLPFPFILPVPIPIPVPIPMDKEKIDKILAKGKAKKQNSENAKISPDTPKMPSNAKDPSDVSHLSSPNAHISSENIKLSPDNVSSHEDKYEIPTLVSSIKSEPSTSPTHAPTCSLPYTSPNPSITSSLYEQSAKNWIPKWVKQPEDVPKWVKYPEESLASSSSLKRSSHSRRCSSATCAELVIDNLCYNADKSPTRRSPCHRSPSHNRSSISPISSRLSNYNPSSPQAIDLSSKSRYVSDDEDTYQSQSDAVDSSDRSSDKELDLSVPQIHIVSASDDPPLSQNTPVLADGTKYSKRRGLILDAPTVAKRPRSPTPERSVYIRTQNGDILEARRRCGRSRIRTK